MDRVRRDEYLLGPRLPLILGIAENLVRIANRANPVCPVPLFDRLGINPLVGRAQLAAGQAADGRMRRIDSGVALEHDRGRAPSPAAVAGKNLGDRRSRVMRVPLRHVLLAVAQVERVQQGPVFQFDRRALGLERVFVVGRANDDAAQAAEFPGNGIESGGERVYSQGEAKGQECVIAAQPGAPHRSVEEGACFHDGRPVTIKLCFKLREFIWLEVATRPPGAFLQRTRPTYW